MKKILTFLIAPLVMLVLFVVWQINQGINNFKASWSSPVLASDYSSLNLDVSIYNGTLFSFPIYSISGSMSMNGQQLAVIENVKDLSVKSYGWTTFNEKIDFSKKINPAFIAQNLSNNITVSIFITVKILFIPICIPVSEDVLISDLL